MLEELTYSLNQISSQTALNFPILLKIIALPWLVFVLNLFLQRRLLYLGIIPRHLIGIPGIFLCPFLHVNFNHLFFNSIPLFVLSDFILIHGLHYFLVVTLLITVLSGALIWCFAKPGIHVGASALITGYWGLLVSNSYLQTNLTSLILGGVSLYYFAGIFLGVFPKTKGVAWEGHLFGLIAGVAASYFLPMG